VQWAWLGLDWIGLDWLTLSSLYAVVTEAGPSAFANIHEVSGFEGKDTGSWARRELRPGLRARALTRL
jgi:hypothetical protein